MKTVRYTSSLKETWDQLIRNSKNGTFLFYRDFMDYHQDRFDDYSLMFYDEDQLIACLPAHISDHRLCSHMGLSYGGLIMHPDITSLEVLHIFDLLKTELKSHNISEIIYKAIPHIYHTQPAEEDLYALFRLDAKLIARQISSTIKLPSGAQYSRTRKRGLKKAGKALLEIKESTDFTQFWALLSNNLKKNHDTKPVHNIKEITKLRNKFPENIKLYLVYNSLAELIAGSVIFLTQELVHLQYTAANDEGKENGAIDFLVDYIISIYESDKAYFDYGISTEDGGRHLNEGLIYQKEGFGARAIVYDTYSIQI